MDTDVRKPERDAPHVPDAPILAVRDLRTYFFADEGVTRAVDGASFDVFAGRTLGVVGESGCGKSVTARSILRIVQRPGRVVDGQMILSRGGESADLARLSPNGREMRRIRGGEIGLVFQEPMTSFSPVHTVGRQITEAVRLQRRLPKQAARERAVELLGTVGVPRPNQLLDAYPWQLSGGLRQRAMIAMALAGDPMLLIADEPTTALDVTTQAQILDLLRDLRRRTGMGIMLITHDLGVIAEMADDVVVMYLGRVVEQGPVDEIFHHPKHPYTQALLRSIPSVDAPARTALPTIVGSVPHPFNRPEGCAFHPRCASAISGRCDRDEPGLHRLGENHEVSCHLYDGSGNGARANLPTKEV